MGNIDFVDLLFGFRGRINRGKFWLAVLIYFIVDIVVALIQYGLGTLGTIVGVIVGLAMFFSGIAVALKRLHDRNKPGWWLVVFYFVPILLFIVGAVLSLAAVAGGSTAGGGFIAIVFYLLGLAIGVWAFVELGCLRGTIGSNEYGPDPLEGRI